MGGRSARVGQLRIVIQWSAGFRFVNVKLAISNIYLQLFMIRKIISPYLLIILQLSIILTPQEMNLYKPSRLVFKSFVYIAILNYMYMWIWNKILFKPSNSFSQHMVHCNTLCLRYVVHVLIFMMLIPSTRLSPMQRNCFWSLWWKQPWQKCLKGIKRWLLSICRKN